MAYSEIGEALLYGRGCIKNVNAAISWIDKALDAEMYVAEEIGDCFRLGNNGLPLDYKGIYELCLRYAGYERVRLLLSGN